MKIVIAPDSFKESLDALQVAEAIARGWQAVFPDAECLLRPMADGGEGTVDAVLAAVGGERRSCQVSGPLGAPVQAHWGWLADGTAVIEMAAASGLHWVAPGQRDILRACSQGTGEALAQLTRVDLSGLDTRLRATEIQVAADVDNPLCGPRGASAVFGPQKGASPQQVAQLDAALAHYARVMAAALGEDHANVPGAGAAGGLGFAARALLGASFRPGIEVVAELSGLADAMQGADLVITGEGRLDAQTLHGKTPLGVARIARAAGVPLVALAGSLGEGYQHLHDEGIDAAFSLVAGPTSLEQACAGAAELLQARSTDLARLWRIARR